MKDSFDDALPWRPEKTAAAPAYLDRLPPHSDEAEQGVLGCCLVDPQTCIGECVVKFKGKGRVFYDEKHHTIYQLLADMYEKQEPVDLITVQQRLANAKILEEVGGLQFLSQLQDGIPSAANLGYYIEIMKEKLLLRRMILIGANIVDRASNHDGDVASLLGEIERDLSTLTETETDVAEEHIKTIMGRVLNDLEENRYIRGKTQLRGLPTGPDGNYLDKLIRGIRESFYFVLAGRPGEGKTSKAMNIVEYLATDYVWYEKTGRMLQQTEMVDGAEKITEVPEMVQRQGIPVAVFSIEMDADSLVARLLFGRAEVDTAEFMQGFAGKSEEFTQKLVKAATEFSRSNIYIDASPAQTMGQIAAKARRMVKQYGIKLFVLDYLQLVEGDDDGRRTDRVKELNQISRKIMALKKQLKVPWMVLCQMNRNIETSEAKRPPVLSDLKDSGAIEQDADVVAFVYKPSRKELEACPEGGLSDKDILENITKGWPWSQRPYRINELVAKNRFGPTGKAEEVFQKNLCRFIDWHMFKIKHGAAAPSAGESPSLLAKHGIDESDLPPDYKPAT